MDWLRLSMTEGIGPVTARQLLTVMGLPEHIFSAPARVLRQVVNRKQAEALLQEPEGFTQQKERTQRWLAGVDLHHAKGSGTGTGRCLLSWADAHYPAALLQMPDPPLLLYAEGQLAQLPALAQQPVLAMVGSRNPTAQGLSHARLFAQVLAAQQVIIVSGLALGIDGAAHEGALASCKSRSVSLARVAEKSGASEAHNEVDGNGDGDVRQPGRMCTVAVLGTGLDRIYPRQHCDLAQRITSCGLLLSECPLGTAPLAANFPKRNRIIAGLAQATLVVEATLQSGSLITARLAADQGKDVLSIPGSIHAPQSRGCHALIRQGAKLVETTEHILEELRHPDPWITVPIIGSAPTESVSPSYTPQPLDATSLSTPTQSILAALGHDPVSLDILQAHTKMPTHELQAELLKMELLGWVAHLPGGQWQRLIKCGEI